MSSRSSSRCRRGRATTAPASPGSSATCPNATPRWREIRAAQSEAERAIASKSEFLSRASHELRTPLNAILGFAQLLALDPVDADHDDSVGHVLRAGRHLLALIDEVLELGMIESGQADVTVAVVELAPLVHTAVAEVEPLAAERGVAVSVASGAPAGARVHADAWRLGQVLRHLLANAVRSNRPGGTAEVDWAGTGDALRIAVVDTGVGIAPDAVDRVFEPFERADADDSTAPAWGSRSCAASSRSWGAGWAPPATPPPARPSGSRCPTPAPPPPSRSVAEAVDAGPGPSACSTWRTTRPT